MPTTPKHYRKPKHSRTISTYAALRKEVEHFRDGSTKFLMILGRGGIGKSRLVEEVLSGTVLKINTAISAIGLYRTLYDLTKHPDIPLMVDDVDVLKPELISLLNAAMNTEEWNTVGWFKNTAFDKSIPLQFETKSRIVLIGNDWKCANASVRALESRAEILLFEPSTYEIHCEAARWFEDQEVYNFIYRHLHLAPELEFRDYKKGAERRKKGSNWKEVIMEWFEENETMRKVLLLLDDPSFRTRTACEEEFKKQGGSHATFWRYVKKIDKNRGEMGLNPILSRRGKELRLEGLSEQTIEQLSERSNGM